MNEWTVATLNNIEESHRNNITWQKLDTKMCLHDSINVTLKKRSELTYDDRVENRYYLWGDSDWEGAWRSLSWGLALF